MIKKKPETMSLIPLNLQKCKTYCFVKNIKDFLRKSKYNLNKWRLGRSSRFVIVMKWWFQRSQSSKKFLKNLKVCNVKWTLSWVMFGIDLIIGFDKFDFIKFLTFLFRKVLHMLKLEFQSFKLFSPIRLWSVLKITLAFFTI